jgi:hypothetical protein
MLYKFLFSILGFFTLVNCQSQKNATTANNSSTNDVSTSAKMNNSQNLIYLKEGENIFLKEQQMNVTFKGIVADSRCPEGVNCIWAGAATALVEVMTTTSRPMQIEISTENLAQKNLNKTQNFAGYNISLEKLLPYPDQKNNTADLKGKYQIALKIEKGNPVQNNNTKPITTE